MTTQLFDFGVTSCVCGTLLETSTMPTVEVLGGLLTTVWSVNQLLTTVLTNNHRCDICFFTSMIAILRKVDVYWAWWLFEINRLNWFFSKLCVFFGDFCHLPHSSQLVCNISKNKIYNIWAHKSNRQVFATFRQERSSGSIRINNWRILSEDAPIPYRPLLPTTTAPSHRSQYLD